MPPRLGPRHSAVSYTKLAGNRFSADQGSLGRLHRRDLPRDRPAQHQRRRRATARKRRTSTRQKTLLHGARPALRVAPARRRGSPPRAIPAPVRRRVELQQVHAARLDPLRDLAAHQHLRVLFAGLPGRRVELGVPGRQPRRAGTLDGEIGQESVDAFEIGLKTAGRRLRFDLAGFYYDYSRPPGQLAIRQRTSPSSCLQSIAQGQDLRRRGQPRLRRDRQLQHPGRRHLAACPLRSRAYYSGHRRQPGGRCRRPECRSAQGTFPNTRSLPVAGPFGPADGARAGFLGLRRLRLQGAARGRRPDLRGNLKYTASYVVTDPARSGAVRPMPAIRRATG